NNNNFSLAEKMKGYRITDDTITFIFTKNIYQPKKLKNKTINTVSIIGSFTAWKNSWELTEKSPGTWSLTTSLNKVKIPGNCGQPEFRFVINDNRALDAPAELSLREKFYDDHGSGYKNIIITPTDDSDNIKEINQRIESYKTDYSSRQELANFREINLGDIGTQTIYRSYHPFKKSRPKHPLEDKRITTVQQLIKEEQISSVINLSDTDTTIPTSLNYYQQLVDNEQVLFTNKGYNYDVFYYIANSNNFAQLVSRIIKFIINNRAPYLIHCRIGTDRTGVIIAILAAFMGASWQEIVADYQQSNQLGIGEYRSEKLLAYTFQQLLADTDIRNELQTKLANYLQNKADLTKNQLRQLKQKLK
ncbi:MAG: tyrosine-protein phosphatase, partial [Bacillota bacterium]